MFRVLTARDLVELGLLFSRLNQTGGPGRRRQVLRKDLAGLSRGSRSGDERVGRERSEQRTGPMSANYHIDTVHLLSPTL